MSRPRAVASRSGHLRRGSATVRVGARRAVTEAEQAGLESSRREAAIAEALAVRDPDRLDPETQSLLLRQLAAARFEAGRHEEALEIAGRVVRLGVLADLGHHERARVLAHRGEHVRAAEAERLAARAAPPDRRAFFLWSEACHLEHAGEIDRALDVLRKAARWATEAGRPLFRAHAAVLRLERGEAVAELTDLVAALEASPQRDGYGRLVLARLARASGDHARAVAHARAFVRRHASSDRAVLDTLAHELAHARRLLRELDTSAS